MNEINTYFFLGIFKNTEVTFIVRLNKLRLAWEFKIQSQLLPVKVIKLNEHVKVALRSLLRSEKTSLFAQRIQC